MIAHVSSWHSSLLRTFLMRFQHQNMINNLRSYFKMNQKVNFFLGSKATNNFFQNGCTASHSTFVTGCRFIVKSCLLAPRSCLTCDISCYLFQMSLLVLPHFPSCCTLFHFFPLKLLLCIVQFSRYCISSATSLQPLALQRIFQFWGP